MSANILLALCVIPWLEVAAQAKAPHFLHTIDLSDYEEAQASGANLTEHLAKRTNVQTCSYERQHSDYQCYTFSELDVESASDVIGQVFYQAAQKQANNANGDCSHSSHVLSRTPVGWDQYASNKDPNDKDCKTTAQIKTINGAMQKWFRSQSNTRLCGVNCIQLTHGGTWKGFVSLSADNGQLNPSTYDCSPQSANTCTSGGSGDCKGGGCS